MKTAAMPLLFLLLTVVMRGQSVVDGFDPNANDAVNAIVVQPDGKVLIGGDFITLSPNGGATVTRNHIARLNPDGTLDMAFDPNVDSANSSVFSIALQTDGKILVGGLFTSIGGQARRHIARLNPDGTLDTAFDPSPDGTDSRVVDIAVQTDGKILVGGVFTTIGGQTRSNLARVDATTGLADSFNPSPDSEVGTIAIQSDGKILAGGVFSNIGGQARLKMARLDPVTGLADGFDPDPNNTPFSIVVQPDDKVLVAGAFSFIGAFERESIARLDGATGVADSFNPTPDFGYMQAVARQADGRVWLGGNFLRIGFQARRYLARVDGVNGFADSLNPNPNGIVDAIAVQADGKILVGGQFTAFAPNGELPVARNHIARLENLPPAPTPTPAPGTCGWSEAARLPKTVGSQAVTSLGTHLYGFGGGTNQPGVSLPCYKFDGTTWTTIAPSPVALIGATAVNDGTNIYVLGGADLPAPGSPPVNTLYKYDPVTNSYVTLSPFATPTYHHAAVYLGGKIYKFGGNSFQNFPTNALEIYDVATNTWTGGANYPLAATGVSAFAHGNFIYAAGGAHISGHFRLTAKTYRYDPATNTWDDAAIFDLPYPRNRAVAAFYNGGGVLAGGVVEDSFGEETVTGSVLSWNPASNTWSALPSMLGRRTVASGGVLNGSFYVVGGRDQTLTTDNQRLTCTPGTGPTPTPSPTPAILANISTRLRVGTGDNVLIGGFIVTGLYPKRIIVRALGPSLPLAGTLADPFLELRNASGGLIATNDNWRFSAHEVEILQTGIPPSHDMEAAIVATLPADGSAYTAIVRGSDNGTGIGMVEAYDLDQTVDSKLSNISTRGLVQTGDDVMIGGLIVLGQNSLRVIVRAIGPSLPVPGALADPTLNLHDSNGALIASNNNWRDDPAQESEIIETGIPPTNNFESAIVRDFAPGQYTAIVRGVNNTTGVALVEVYGLD
jgi:uncharacterized delta-60 repeat protein